MKNKKNLEQIAWRDNRSRWENKEGEEVFPIPFVEATHFDQYFIVSGDDSNYALAKKRLSILKQMGVITPKQENMVNAYSFGRSSPKGGRNVFFINFYKI